MITECIEARIKTAGEQQVLITRGGVWNAKQLTGMISQASASLEGKLDMHEPVGLAFPNSLECLITLSAMEQTGNTVVLLGAGLKPRELGYHIKNSGIRKILAAPRLSACMQEAGGASQGELPQLPDIELWSFENNTTQRLFQPGDFICQLTSGTNGLSKAAVRTKDALYTEIREVTTALCLSRQDTVLVIPPMNHSFGLMAACCALYGGARLILMDGFAHAEVIDYIQRGHVTLIFAVPFMYHLLHQASAGQSVDFSALRFCISAGAPLHKDIASHFQELTGKRICQIYGSTETGVITLNLHPDEKGDSAGKPIGIRQVCAFDENGRMLPPGAAGELRTCSAADASAYVYPAELNAAAFPDGWFVTGDYGTIDADGYVYVGGRKSSIINVAGMKVDPVEVENMITSLPGVKEAVVVGVDTGSGGQIVKAVIVPDKTGIDKKSIIDACRKALSDFKVPRVIEFLDELPRSQTGKILRKYLNRME